MTSVFFRARVTCQTVLEYYSGTLGVRFISFLLLGNTHVIFLVDNRFCRLVPSQITSFTGQVYLKCISAPQLLHMDGVKVFVPNSSFPSHLPLSLYSV